MNLSILKIKDFEINIKLFNPKFYCGIALTLAAIIVLQVTGASLRATCGLSLLLGALSVLEIKCNARMTKLLNGVWAATAVFVLFYLPQFILKFGLGALSNGDIVLGLMVTAAVLLLLYIFTRNVRASVIVSSILLLTLTVVNYYVVRFRGEELSPTDIFAFGTAANVASDYEFFGDITLFYFLWLAIIFCFAGFCIPNFKGKFKKANMLSLIGTEVILIAILVIGISKVDAQFFTTCGTQMNGFYVNFLAKLKTNKVECPEIYNESFITEMEETYGISAQQENETKPDIIVIMGEAFGDLRVVGDLHTDVEVMPFYDSLAENTIKGKALVSVYGGGTCNSEFEVLTGHSMSNLPMKTYPYQQYIEQDTWSMAAYLKDLGYKTMATHPERALNWMRESVYPYLGFEDTKFIDDYKKEDLVRGHVSDLEMYQQIISWYEEEKGEDPLFYFGVTMQNHSPYDNEYFSSSVNLEGYSVEYPEVEQYLTLTQMSDQALQYLVEYFETVEDEVVILFFGDHMPQLDAFYEEVNGGPLETLEDEMDKRTVPFVVWANYDIEEKEIEYTSLNYLSSFVYEAAGIELPAYNKVMEETREQIPAISAYGYYSKETDGFKTLEDMNEEEQKARDIYASLQYHALFEEKEKSQVFFSTED